MTRKFSPRRSAQEVCLWVSRDLVTGILTPRAWAKWVGGSVFKTQKTPTMYARMTPDEFAAWNRSSKRKSRGWGYDKAYIDADYWMPEAYLVPNQEDVLGIVTQRIIVVVGPRGV